MSVSFASLSILPKYSGSTFWSKKECEGGYHVKGMHVDQNGEKLAKIEKSEPKSRKTGQNREKVDQNRVGMHMSSGKNLFHTLFWTKKWNTELKS